MGITISKLDNRIQTCNSKNDVPDIRDRKTIANDNQGANTPARGNGIQNEIDTTHIQVRIHDETGDTMISVIDDNTGEVIRELPPEKFLDMIVAFQKIDGIFIDRKV